jgi:Transposase DDE domain group 1
MPGLKRSEGTSISGGRGRSLVQLRSAPAPVQKSGGLLKISNPDSPPRVYCRSVCRGAPARAAALIILDLDATDDPLHGHQEGRFFHAYYDCLLAICCSISSVAGHLLAAKLRRSNIGASAGAVGRKWRVSSPKSAPAGLGCGFYCAPIRALPARN